MGAKLTKFPEKTKPPKMFICLSGDVGTLEEFEGDGGAGFGVGQGVMVVGEVVAAGGG